MTGQPQEQEIVVIQDKLASNEPLSYDDIRRNTELVKKLVKECLIIDVDYGKIPGCGDRPCLFKPGAEKIAMLFKIGAFPEIQDLSEPDLIKYVVKTRIIHIPSGRELGVGIGGGSTDEEKYKWRKAVCDEEYEATVEERRRIKWSKGYYNKQKKEWGKPTQIKQVRTNPADLNNTILKMSKKRSFVDAVISCTAASDLLTQDLEENAAPQTQQQTSQPQIKTDGIDQSKCPKGYKLIKAGFESMCKSCSSQIEKGSIVAYSQTKGTFHPDCAVS